MSIPGSISTNTNLSRTIMNNNLHQQQFLFDQLKNYHSNKTPSISNFSFDPDLLHELNARFLHDMNATHNLNRNGFSTFLRSKPNTPEHNLNVLTKSDNNLLSSPPKKSNKWCTAHVRISWMIYHHQQQQRLKDKLSLLDKEQQSSYTKPILPFLPNDSSLLPRPSFNYRSPFDVSNSSFGGLGSLFPSVRKSDMNGSIPPSQFHRNIGSFSSINDNFSSKKFDEINRKHFNNEYHHLTNKNSSLSLSRKSSSDNLKTSSHSLPLIFPPVDPLTLSIIERQHLSATYASLFASASHGKNFFPTNIDPMIFRNTNSSSLFTNFDPSGMTAALIQREYFLNSLRLSQQQQQHEHGTIVDNNNKTLKTKFEQISPTNKEETKRIKLEHATSPTSNSSISSSIKSKHVKREKQSSSPSSIASTNKSHDLTSKGDSFPSISTTT